MGSAITADPWLLALVFGSEPASKVGALVIRTQALTAARTGHIIATNDEYVRRKIIAAARWGKLAGVSVRCIRCGWQAPLTWWAAGAVLKGAERKEAIQGLYIAKRPEDTAYLRQCPGEEYARDIMQITSAPADRGE